MTSVTSKLRLFSILALTGWAASSYAPLAFGAACTYDEALMAFQQGNQLRGQALLNMAAKDGDPRAKALFSQLQAVVEQGKAIKLLVLPEEQLFSKTDSSP